MSGEKPNPIRLYRIVHIKNIEYILKNGLYTRQSSKFDPNYINIGDSTLIAQRHDYPIPMNGFGNLGDYVPFYFAGHSPMLLNIKTGYRGITRRPQSDIVYIACVLDDVVANCQEWILTDGHAKDRLTGFYTNLEALDQIDWDMVREQYWAPTEEDYGRQRRKQAEFLVKHYVPVSCIEGIIVKEETQRKVIEKHINALNLSLKLAVDTNNTLYYP